MSLLKGKTKFHNHIKQQAKLCANQNVMTHNFLQVNIYSAALLPSLVQTLHEFPLPIHWANHKEHATNFKSVETPGSKFDKTDNNA